MYWETPEGRDLHLWFWLGQDPCPEVSLSLPQVCQLMEQWGNWGWARKLLLIGIGLMRKTIPFQYLTLKFLCIITLHKGLALKFPKIYRPILDFGIIWAGENGKHRNCAGLFVIDPRARVEQGSRGEGMSHSNTDIWREWGLWLNIWTESGLDFGDRIEPTGHNPGWSLPMPAPFLHGPQQWRIVLSQKASFLPCSCQPETSPLTARGQGF